MTFSPKLETVNPDYSSYSGPNSGAELFEGLGDAITNFTKVANQYTTASIEQDAQSMFKAVNDDFDAQLPPDFKNMSNKAKTLTDALNQGNISNTYYYNNLAAEASRIKSKYPGHKKEVDQIISRVTGVNPANARRNAILAEYNKNITSRNAELTRRRKWIEDNAGTIGQKYGDVFENIEEVINDDEKYAEIQTYDMNKKVQAAQDEERKRNLSSSQQEFEHNKPLLLRQYEDRVGVMTAEGINSIGASMAKKMGFDSMEELVQAGQSGAISTQQLQEAIVGLHGVRRQIRQQMFDYVNNVSNGYIDNADLVKLVDEQLSLFVDPYIEALGGKDWDAIAGQKKLNDYMSETDLKRVMGSSADARIIRVAANIHPDVAKVTMSEILTGGKETLGQSFAKALVSSIVLGQDTLSGATERVRNSETSSKDQGQMIRQITEDNERLLSSPDFWKESKDNAVRYAKGIFVDKGDPMMNLSPSSRETMFMKLTSPKVVSNVFASGDEELINGFVEWSNRHVLQTPGVKDLVKEVKNINFVSDAMKPELGEDGKISVLVDKKKMDAWFADTRLGGVQRMNRGREIHTALESVEKFNRLSQHMAMIHHQMGLKPRDVADNMLARAGVELKTGEQSWLDWITDAIDTTTTGLAGEGVLRGAGETDSSILLQDWLSDHPELLRMDASGFVPFVEKEVPRPQPVEGESPKPQPRVPELPSSDQIGDQSSVLEEPEVTKEVSSTSTSTSTSKSTPTSGRQVVGVIDAGKGYTVVKYEDGSEERRKGTRAVRNNNPGNIEWGKFAKSKGAVGTDGRFAVFPTVEAGYQAMASLLFESPSYRNLTLSQAIARYAPAFENNVPAYVRAASGGSGITPNTVMKDIPQEQRIALLKAMSRHEGFA